jgi:teichuronic acid biosynthesis glycosyltransferase TuaG
MAEVAVIMPCHNCEVTIGQAIGSVIAQTYTDWELVIVDDGSKDGSPALIASLAARDPRIRVITNAAATGAAAARNRGIQSTSARYTAFLDSDDVWLPNKLELQLKAMAEHDAALCCGAYDVINGENCVTGSVRPKPGALTYRGMMGNNSVGCLTAIVDRSLTGPIRFNDDLPRSEDYQLWLSILRRGLKGVCIPETLGQYRLHGKSLSSNKFSAARNRWRVYREFEKHNVLKSAFYLTAYAVTGVMKTVFMRRKQLFRGSGDAHSVQ